MPECFELFGAVDREDVEQRRMRLGGRHAGYIYGKGLRCLVAQPGSSFLIEEIAERVRDEETDDAEPLVITAFMHPLPTGDTD